MQIGSNISQLWEVFRTLRHQCRSVVVRGVSILECAVLAVTQFRYHPLFGILVQMIHRTSKQCKADVCVGLPLSLRLRALRLGQYIEFLQKKLHKNNLCIFWCRKKHAESNSIMRFNVDMTFQTLSEGIFNTL